MKLNKEFLAVILLLISFNIGRAQRPQGTFKVKGKVIEKTTGKALEYVNVVIYNQRDSSLVSGTITGIDGSFEIISKRPGKFYLTADFIGYEKQLVNNLVLKPGSSNLNVGVLKLLQSNVGIEEVEVVGERPFVSYQIDKKVIDVSKNPLAQGGTAVEALENVPSVETDMEGNVSVRGSTEFTVLIDGRQSPISGGDALKQIPASAIDKIEIITNPSVKYDPDGTAGIINVITKKGKLKGHSLVLNTSVGTSPMASINANYTYRMKKATVYAGAGFRDFRMQIKTFDDREILDTLDQLTKIGTDRIGNMQHGNLSLKGGVDYFLSDRNTISFGLSYNSFKFGREFDSRILTSDLYGTTNQLSFSGFNVTPKTWQFNVGDKQVFSENKDHYLTIDFFYQKRVGDNNDNSEIQNANSFWKPIEPMLIQEKANTYENTTKSRLEINYSLPISDKLKVESGYTLRIDQSNKDYTRFLMNETSERWQPNSEFDDKSEYARNINAVWALAKGELFGFGYSAGLRGENTSRTTQTSKDSTKYVYDDFDVFPSAAISKEWKGNNSMQANLSRRINRPRDYHLNPFPALSDGYNAFKPNPELKPEYAWAFEVNYQKSWGRQFLALETFYRDTKNEIDRVFSTVSDTLLVREMINLGSEKSVGGELGGNVKVAKWWYVNPVVTFYYYTSEGTYNDVPKKIESSTSRMSLTNNFTTSSKTRIQLMGNYRGPRESIDGRRNEMYWVSAAVRHSFFDRKLSAVFRVDDIFSTRKRASTTISGNTTVYGEGQRKSPMFIFSLSLNLNQTNDKRNGRRNMDGGEGMDMDF